MFFATDHTHQKSLKKGKSDPTTNQEPLLPDTSMLRNIKESNFLTGNHNNSSIKEMILKLIKMLLELLLKATGGRSEQPINQTTLEQTSHQQQRTPITDDDYSSIENTGMEDNEIYEASNEDVNDTEHEPLITPEEEAENRTDHSAMEKEFGLGFNPNIFSQARLLASSGYRKMRNKIDPEREYRIPASAIRKKTNQTPEPDDFPEEWKEAFQSSSAMPDELSIESEESEEIAEEKVEQEEAENSTDHSAMEKEFGLNPNIFGQARLLAGRSYRKMRNKIDPESEYRIPASAIRKKINQTPEPDNFPEGWEEAFQSSSAIPDELSIESEESEEIAEEKVEQEEAENSTDHSAMEKEFGLSPNIFGQARLLAGRSYRKMRNKIDPESEYRIPASAIRKKINQTPEPDNFPEGWEEAFQSSSAIPDELSIESEESEEIAEEKVEQEEAENSTDHSAMEKEFGLNPNIFGQARLLAGRSYRQMRNKIDPESEYRIPASAIRKKINQTPEPDNFP